MLIKRLFLICSIPSLIVGCAEFYDTQPPAPVYGSGTPLYGNKPLPKDNTAGQPTKPTAKESGDTVKTVPLITPKELKPQPLPAGEKLLTPAQEQELSALQNPIELEPEETERKPKPKPKPKPEPVVEEQPVAPVEVVAPSVSFKPLESFSPMSPVVGSLVIAANEDSQKGNTESAATTLERASRIEPRNATLYYKMALLQLKTKPSQAEDLAKKSALLAANDNALKKHSWLLVAKAREMQKNFAGAKEARAKASKY